MIQRQQKAMSTSVIYMYIICVYKAFMSDFRVKRLLEVPAALFSVRRSEQLPSGCRSQTGYPAVPAA